MPTVQAYPTRGEAADLNNGQGGDPTLVSMIAFLRTATGTDYHRPGRGNGNIGYMRAAIAATAVPSAICNPGNPHIHVGQQADQANVIIDSATKTIHVGAAKKHKK